jgi:hypothetical protein
MEKNMQMQLSKEWDLNIFFKEVLDESGEYVPADTLTINPVVYTFDGIDYSDNLYTDTIIDTTFAETRYLVSQYPVNEYGYDWTDTLDNFLAVAPPRLAELLKKLPDASTVTQGNSENLVS